MKNFPYLLVLSFACFHAGAGTGKAHVIENARDLSICTYDNLVERRPFAFEAIVSAPSRTFSGRFTLCDDTGSATLYDQAFWPTNQLLAGDRIFLSGFVRHDADGKNYAMATNIRIAGALETDRLLFSVSDDGCGFDPDNRSEAIGIALRKHLLKI